MYKAGRCAANVKKRTAGEFVQLSSTCGNGVTERERSVKLRHMRAAVAKSRETFGAHAMKCFSVGRQQLSVSDVSLSALGPACKSAVGSEWPCVRCEAPLHPSPSAAAKRRQQCASANTVSVFIYYRR